MSLRTHQVSPYLRQAGLFLSAPAISGIVETLGVKMHIACYAAARMAHAHVNRSQPSHPTAKPKEGKNNYICKEGAPLRSPCRFSAPGSKQLGHTARFQAVNSVFAR